MKIRIEQYTEFWSYFITEWCYNQKPFDYVFKYLDFDKLDKKNFIHFKNKETEEWFYKTYIDKDWLEDIDEDWLEDIYDQSPEGYQYLRDNWGKDFFVICVNYPDKQKLKTIVNRVINIELKRKI